MRRGSTAILFVFALLCAGVTSRALADYACPEGFTLNSQGMCKPDFSFLPHVASRAPYSKLNVYPTAGGETFDWNESDEGGSEVPEYDDDADSELDYTLEPHNRIVLVCYPSDSLITNSCASIQAKYEAENCGIQVIRFDSPSPAELTEEIAKVYPPLPPRTYVIIAGHGGNDPLGRHFMAGLYPTTQLADSLATAIDRPQINVTACQSGATFTHASDNYDLVTSSRGTELSNISQAHQNMDPATHFISDVMCDQNKFGSLTSRESEVPLVDGDTLRQALARIQNWQVPQISSNFTLIAPHATDADLLVHQQKSSRRSNRHLADLEDDAELTF